MTNQELQERLKQYPPDWHVWMTIADREAEVIELDEDAVEKSIVLYDR